VRFYRVTEAPPSRPGHLVAHSHYEDDPVDLPGVSISRYVGCTPYMLTRRPATADDLCRQLHVGRLADLGEYGGHAPAPASWVLPDPDPLTATAQENEWARPIVFAERRPVPMCAERPPRLGQDVYVVLRRHWRLELTESDFWRWSLTRADSCGRPVAAFDTLAAADACQAGLEAEARQQVASPFRFGPPHEWGTLHGPAIWGILSDLAPIRFTNQWDDYRAQDRLWCRWWDEAAPALTAGQVETVWALYDRLRFYEVVAVEYRE
jgi:hypothetical protein